MIIKYKSVKCGAQLKNVINYISSDKGRIDDYRDCGIFHNLLSNDLAGVKKEFLENYQNYARKRSNGNLGVHVIISLNPSSQQKISPMLFDNIIMEHILKWYPRALTFGVHHKKDKHRHAHLFISSNQIRSPKNYRMSKRMLKQAYMDLQKNAKQKCPEYDPGIDINEWGQKKNSEREYYQRKRNNGVKLTKVVLTDTVKGIFAKSENSRDFYRALKKNGMRTYNYKGKPIGVYWGEENKKMRFSRLGVHKDHIQQLDKQAERLKEIHVLRSYSFSPSRDVISGDRGDDNDRRG